MLQSVFNQISKPNSSSENLTMFESVGIWISIFGVAAFLIEVYRRTRTKVSREPIENYIDDNLKKKITIFKCELKFKDNPLFQRITLFEFEGNAEYKITGNEFNTYPVILNNNLFFEISENSLNKIKIYDKSHFKKRKISSFLIQVETDYLDYRAKIRECADTDRIQIINENQIDIRNFIFSISKDVDISQLRRDPRVQDVYSEGNLWFIKIHEIRAASINQSETMTLLL